MHVPSAQYPWPEHVGCGQSTNVVGGHGPGNERGQGKKIQLHMIQLQNIIATFIIIIVIAVASPVQRGLVLHMDAIMDGRTTATQSVVAICNDGRQTGADIN